jgi:hypothetical protein
VAARRKWRAYELGAVDRLVDQIMELPEADRRELEIMVDGMIERLPNRDRDEALELMAAFDQFSHEDQERALALARQVVAEQRKQRRQKGENQ